MKTDAKVLAADREDGARRASIWDFRSFRVVTLVLTAGMPLEFVQRVTRHKTTDIVLKHYFRPARAEFKRTLENAMPEFFMRSIDGVQDSSASLPAGEEGRPQMGVGLAE